MRFIYCFIILLFGGLTSYAQNYSGTVLNSEQEPIPFASVVIKKSTTSEVISGKLTNEEGLFQVEANTSDSLLIEVSYVGYEKKIITNPAPDLGKIILQRDNSLEEVVVTGKKDIIEQQPDRLVYNVSSATTANAGNAEDVLRQTPGLTIQNDQLSIIGKGTVNVLINDRLLQMNGEELMSYLNTISSEQIEKVEVITAPPARYDAQGNGGLINIVLKKPEENHWNNSLTASAYKTTYSAGKISDQFTYNHNKLSVMASATARAGYEKQHIRALIPYEEGPWETVMLSKDDQTLFSGRVNADYQVNNKHSVGVIYAGNYYSGDEENKTTVSRYQQNSERMKSQSLSEGIDNSHTANHSLNAHYLYKIDTVGRELSVDADLFQFVKPQNVLLYGGEEEEDFFKNRNISAMDIRNSSLKLDMAHPTNFANLSYGAKYSSSNTANNISFYEIIEDEPVLNEEQSNEFDYKEQVAAAYLSANKKINESLQVSAGLRGEHIQTKGNSRTLNQVTERNYTKLFPTAYATYKISDKQSANLNYAKRIERPQFWALNPFKYYISKNSYSVGNPFIQPSITQSVELQHIYDQQFITKLFYSEEANGFGEVLSADSEIEQIISSKDNFYDKHSFGVSETIQLQPARLWSASANMALYNNQTGFRDEYADSYELKNGWSYYLHTQQTFSFGEEKNYEAETTFRYLSPQNEGLFRTDNFYSLDLGFRAQLFEEKLQINLSAYDILKTSRPEIYVNNNQVRQTYYSYHDNRYGKLSFTYKFGNNAIKANRRDFGNADEQNRAN